MRSPRPLVQRPGQTIPGTRYRIVRWLGQGAMGTVYEAEHLDMERRVAVKILRAGADGNPAMLQAFRDEARAASRIRSDHVVQLYDFTTLADEKMMIAMELLDGQPLAQAMSPGEPMALGRALGILRQVCKGLSAAHEAGVVHRDIKPENVFLTAHNGRSDAVKLLDFGIAAIHDGRDVAFMRGGTPSYLAPEVSVEGSAEIGVDVYSWGCMAFEVLTGRLPFEGETTAEVLCAHLAGTPVPPSSLRPGIPPALDAVVLRCLEKDPRDRFASMVEVEAALCEVQLQSGLRTAWDDLPLPMVDPDRRARLVALLPDTPRLPSWSRRRSILLSAAVALVLSVPGIDALASRDEVRTEKSALSGWVEARGNEARDAAAKALFVYPPVDDPDHPTAYTVVLTLEGREGPQGPAARRLARSLRDEFASTLVRLGNHYWGKESGKRFAAAYYDQALLFDPSRAVARERGSLDVTSFDEFARRASAQAFTEAELLGAEPLAVLAAPDAESRREKLATLREQQERRAKVLAEDLVRLGDLSVEMEAVAVNSPAPALTPVPASAPAPTSTSVGSDEASLEPTPTDPSQARRLADQGRRALATGKLDRAADLFEQALGHDRRHTGALAGLRDVAFERGDYPGAVKLGERVVRKRPRDGAHRLRLGDAYLKVLRYRDALAQYERAVELGEARAKWRVDKVRATLSPR